MLRTMRLDRPGLMLLILTLPISEAAAGPIFTHSSGAAGTRGWIQGNTGRDLPGSVIDRPDRSSALGFTLERRATGPSWQLSCFVFQRTSTAAIPAETFGKQR